MTILLTDALAEPLSTTHKTTQQFSMALFLTFERLCLADVYSDYCISAQILAHTRSRYEQILFSSVSIGESAQ